MTDDIKQQADQSARDYALSRGAAEHSEQYYELIFAWVAGLQAGAAFIQREIERATEEAA